MNCVERSIYKAVDILADTDATYFSLLFLSLSLYPTLYHFVTLPLSLYLSIYLSIYFPLSDFLLFFHYLPLPSLFF